MVELATIATGLDPVAQPRAAAVDNGSDAAAARFDTEQTSTNRALTRPMTGMELIQQVLELCTDLLVMA